MAFLIVAIALLPAEAQSKGMGWNVPLSVSEGLDGPSQFPKVVSDSDNTLHIAWVENSYAVRNVADAVYYSYYDGRAWSSPIDVLVSPDRRSIILGELVFLPNNMLALLWIGAGNLQYSTVGAADALRPTAWKTTSLFAGYLTTNAYMTLESSGVLHVAFVGPTFEVLYAKSIDLGDTWTEPEIVWRPLGDGYAASDIRICANETGQILHMIWHENAREFGWNPYGILYTRSVDGGDTWQDAELLANRGSSPNCMYDGQGDLHMMWNNAVSSVDGRYHRRSSDDGASWSTSTPIFAGLSGRTRAPSFALDGNGSLHVLTGAYDGYATRMFWSSWQGNRWTTPESISVGLVSNESPDMVVSGADRLQAVWHFGNEDSSKIWYASLQVSVPTRLLGDNGLGADNKTTPAAPFQPQQIVGMELTPNSRQIPNPQLSAEDYPAAVQQEFDRLPSANRATSESALLLSFVSALTVVCLAIVGHLTRRGVR